MRRILGLSLAIITIALFFSVTTELKLHLLYDEAEKKAISVYANPEPQSVQDDIEAFIRYLQMPGAEYAASRIGRSRPEEFFQILQEYNNKNKLDRTKPGLICVEGDLLLTLGRDDKALNCYRKAATLIAAPQYTSQETTLCTDYIIDPPEDFPVETAESPYTAGPGSHRDNLLIKRFIAMSAWDDAQREFERIWKIYSLISRPYIFIEEPGRKTASSVDKPASIQKSLISSQGFNSPGLRFALDYAYFLMRRNEKEKAFSVLMEPISEMDMDKNPNLVVKGKVLSGQYPEVPLFLGGDIASRLFQGVSRREYVRLTYGELRSSGCEDKLVSMLEKQIEEGQKRARRVLARVRLHQGRTDDSLKLELEYIAKGNYDELTRAYRRGLIYDNMQKPAEAAEEYEKALSLPYHSPSLPDDDEEKVQDRLMHPGMQALNETDSMKTEQAFRINLLTRLCHLYTALGMKSKAINATVKLIELNPRLLTQMTYLESVKTLFRASGREAEFTKWIKEMISKEKEAARKTSLCWVIGDYGGAAKSIAACRSGDIFRSWRVRFQEKGKDAMLLLLRARTAQKPDDALSRLQLLDLEDRWNPSEVIPALESLLLSNNQDNYAGFCSLFSRAQHRDVYDCAYRLMRLYERTGQLDKLRKLGLQIARQEKPFIFSGYDPVNDYQYYHCNNGGEEEITACLSLLVQHAGDEETQKDLGKALDGKAYPWSAARKQLSRRCSSTLPASNVPLSFGWANVPGDVNIIASNENILSLESDNDYVYAGMPWGVAVYTHRGKPVTRIALETDAFHMAVQDRNLWIASTQGLYRIRIGIWKAERIRLDGDTKEKGLSDRSLDSKNSIDAMALDGDSLWISSHRTIQRYDICPDKLFVFGDEELKAKKGITCKHFIVEKDYIWADGYEGCRRYNRSTGQWDRVVWGEHDAHLISLVDGIMWGHLRVNDELRDRVCIIDRRTMEVTPVFIEESNRYDRSINGPFRYFGRWNGKPVFGTEFPSYFYDAQIGKLRGIPDLKNSRPPGGNENTIPPAIAITFERWNKEGNLICDDDSSWYELAPGRYISMKWNIKKLPDRTRVIGKGSDYPSIYNSLSEDGSKKRESWIQAGGLYFLLSDGGIERSSSILRNDAIPADTVRDIVFGPSGTAFICTNIGIAKLNDRNEVVETFTRSDGLYANCILNGAPLGKKIYFASEWGEGGGGLIVYDCATEVFTSFCTSDGMARNNLRSISAENGRLFLTYGTFNSRVKPGDVRTKRSSLPDVFDPFTGKFFAGTLPKNNLIEKSNTKLHNQDPEPMPVIGGSIIKKVEHGENIYLCGTKGLLIYKKGRTPYPDIAIASPSVVGNSSAKLIEEAWKLKIEEPLSPEGLKTLLRHQNPYVRVRALEETLSQVCDKSPGYVPVIESAINDSFPRVRLMAAHLLSESDDSMAIKPLKTALNDKDPYVRAIAAMALAKRGSFAPLSCFKEILANPGFYGNLPYGINSTIGVVVDEEEVYPLLAPRADMEVFALFMNYPPDIDESKESLNMMTDLGGSLKKHPEAAELLLNAKSSDSDQVHFARQVFTYAGKDMLPLVHKALESENRVIRSNAAQACGGINDPSSIPILIKALDLESGLSRASIVWALGELRAKQSMPALTKLYTDSRNDENHHSGSGFRAGQMKAALNSEYEILSDLSSISTEWSELKLSTLREPFEPSYEENLLRPDDILKAIRKIGSEDSYEFYRALAGDKETGARNEAAEGLAGGAGEELQKNLNVLQGLLGDENRMVSMNAAVSLHIAGQDQSRMILKWLDSNDRWVKRGILRALLRVNDRSKLTFAMGRIKAIAEDKSLDREFRDSARKILEH